MSIAEPWAYDSINAANDCCNGSVAESYCARSASSGTCCTSNRLRVTCSAKWTTSRGLKGSGPPSWMTAFFARGLFSAVDEIQLPLPVDALDGIAFLPGHRG